MRGLSQLSLYDDDVKLKEPSQQAQQSIQVVHGLRSGHSDVRHTPSACLVLLRSSSRSLQEPCARISMCPARGGHVTIELST